MPKRSHNNDKSKNVCYNPSKTKPEGLDMPFAEKLSKLRKEKGFTQQELAQRAGVGIALTYLGNVISGYPIPPSVGIYAWNASIMAGIGATLGPPMAWSLLRAVPLWRTLLEPAVAAVVASALTMRFAPGFFVAAVPLSVTAAALRLRWAYRDADRKSLSSGDDAARDRDAALTDGER